MKRSGLPRHLLGKNRHALPLHHETLFSTLSEITRIGLSTGKCEWSALDSLAMPCEMEREQLLHHRVAPLFAEWDDAGTLTAERKNWLMRIAMRAMLQETHWRKTLTQIGELFAAAGVAALLTKGTGLAYTLYEKPQLRSRQDTDLWIPTAAREKVLALLARANFKTVFEQTRAGFSVIQDLPNGETLSLDVKHFAHWRPSLAKALRWEDAWDRSQPTSLGIRAVGFSDALLLAALNRVADLSWQSRAMPFIQVIDACLLWDRLGDEAVARTLADARVAGVGEAMRYLLLLAAACRRRPPSSATQSLWATSDAGTTHFYFKEGFNDQAAFYLDVRSLGGAREKIKYLWSLVAPGESETRYWWNLNRWKARAPRTFKLIFPLLARVLHSINAFRIVGSLARGRSRIHES